jgi:hypothetical protein
LAAKSMLKDVTPVCVHMINADVNQSTLIWINYHLVLI